MNPSSFIASSLNSSEDLASQLISIINLTANIVKSIHASEKTEYYQDLLSLSLPQNQLSGNYKLSKSNDKKDLGSLKLKDKPALLTENKNILLNKLLRSNNTDEKSEKINIEKSVCCENKTCEVSPVIMNDTKSSFHSHSEIVPNVQNMNLELLNKNKTSYNSESFNLPSKAMLYSNQLIKDSRSHFENSLPNRPVGIAADCEDSDSDSIVFICESSNSFNNKLPDNNMNAQNENNIQSEEFNRAKRFKYTEQTDKSVIDPHKITEHFRSNVNQNVIPEDVLNSISCFNVHAKNSIDKLPTLSEVLSYNHSATKYSDTGDKHSYSETFNLPNKDMVYSNQLVNNSTTSLPNVPVHIKADCEDSKSDSFSFACKSSNSCSNKLPDKSMKAQYGNNIQAEEDNRVKCLKCSEQTNKSVINVHKIARNFRSKINGNVVPEANLNSSTCFNVHAKNSTDKLPTLSEVLSYNHLATKYSNTGDKLSYSETFNLPSKDMVYSNQLVYNSTSHFRTSLPNVPVHIKADCEDSNSDSFSFVYKSSNSCSNKLPDKSMNAQYENNIQAEEDNRVKCLKCSELTDKSVMNVHKIAENFRSKINGNAVPEANLNSSTCFNVHAKNSIDKLPTLSELLSYNHLATKYADIEDALLCSEYFNLPSKGMLYSNQLINDSTSHFENSLPNVPVCIEGDCEESDSDSVIFVYESNNKLPDKNVNVQYENNIQSQDDNRVKCFKSEKQIDKSVIDAHKIAEHFPSNINQNITPEAIHNCFNIHDNNSIDKLPAFSEVSSYNPLAIKYSDTGHNYSCSEASVLQENCERVSAADIGFIHSELDTIKPCEVNCSSDERILNKNIEPTEITAVELRKIIDIAQNMFFEKKSLDIQSTSNYSYAGTEYVDRMSSSSVELPYKDCNSKFPDTDDKIFHSEMSVNRQNNITEGQSVISDVTDIIQTSYIENHIGLQNKIPFSCPDNGTVYTRMGMIQRREDGENSKKCFSYREKETLKSASEWKKVQNGNAERLMFNTKSKGNSKLYEHLFKELSSTPESACNFDVQNEKCVKCCSHFINSLNKKTIFHLPKSMKRSKNVKKPSSETVAVPSNTESKEVKMKGKKLNKRKGKCRTPKITISEQPLFTPDKVLKSIPKMNTDETTKNSDDYNTNRCYGKRVTNRGKFLTEEIVNTPPKIKRGQRSNISAKSVFTARVDEYHAMAQSPEIEIVSRRILPERKVAGKFSRY